MTLDIQLDIPRPVCETSVDIARASAREAAIMALQQQGELTMQEAAMQLELNYYGYLDLLAKHGLPASNYVMSPDEYEAARAVLVPKQEAL